MNIIFVIPPHVQLFDLAGPQQVFREAKQNGLDIIVEFYGLTTDPVAAGGVGLAGLPSYNQSSPRKDDFIFVPGIQMENISIAQDICPEFLRWLCDMDKKQVNICSVYTATFILAEAGILDHKECTTHWRGINILQKRYPKLKVIEDVLYVKSGNIYTSAGISSGIDMALAIIETIAGPKFTHSVAKGLVMYQRRSATHTQQSVYLDYRNHIHPKIHAVQDYLIGHLDKAISIDQVAEFVHMSPRNLTRIFKEKTAITIMQYLTLLRIEAAKTLKTDPSYTVDTIAAKCGLKSRRQLHRILKHEGNLIRKC